MFRTMQRTKQQLPEAECVAILQQELRGVLSVLGDDGYPYGMPLNHYYCEADGKLYFHSGKIGHKIDAIRRCDKASFCVYDRGVREEGEWALRIRSVIVFGRIELITDRETIIDIATNHSHKFTDDEAYIEKEIAQHLKRTLLFALVPEQITGKIVTES